MKDENLELEDLKSRTKRIALRVIRFYCELPKTTEAQVLGRQLLRSGTSAGGQRTHGHFYNNREEDKKQKIMSLGTLHPSSFLTHPLASGRVLVARVDARVERSRPSILVTRATRKENSL